MLATIVPSSPTHHSQIQSQNEHMNFPSDDMNLNQFQQDNNDDFAPIPAFPERTPVVTFNLPPVPTPAPINWNTAPVVSGSGIGNVSYPPTQMDPTMRKATFSQPSRSSLNTKMHLQNVQDSNASTKTCTCILEPAQLFPNANTAPTRHGKDTKEFLSSMLHRVCQQYPRKKRYIEAALKKDPSAVSRRVLIPAEASSQKQFQQKTANKCCSTCQLPTNEAAARMTPEPYQLALNIALAHNASLEVIDVLVSADPSQVLQRDGLNGMNSLGLALEKKPNDVALLGMLLVKGGITLVKQRCDHWDNTPLHVACQRGSALPIVRQLYHMHPRAVQMRNQQGKTPLDILMSQAALSFGADSKRAQECLDYLTKQQQQNTSV